MFCSYCGNKIENDAVVCPNCGAKTAQPNAAQSAPVRTYPVVEQPATEEKSNNIAIAGFVLSFFVALAGLICSIIGLKKAKSEGAAHQGLATAGIIISTLNLVGSFIAGIIGIFYAIVIFGMLAGGGGEVDPGTMLALFSMII